MSLAILLEPVPLSLDEEGVARIANTRVTLDTLVMAFHQGVTAEEFAQQYPSLALADIYAVIGYYLKHWAEVDAYLKRREQQAEVVRRQNEGRFDPSGVRERLLARRQGSGNGT